MSGIPVYIGSLMYSFSHPGKWMLLSCLPRTLIYCLLSGKCRSFQPFEFECVESAGFLQAQQRVDTQSVGSQR
jgi:hypothetical protein